MEIKPIVDSLVDLFFPARCLGCSSVINRRQYFCVSCLQAIPFTHFSLSQDNLVYHRLRSLCLVESATAVFFFEKEHLSQQILHAIKYKNQEEIGALFAEKIQLPPQVFDGILPMPIHTNRLKERGYNQVLSFAKALGRINSIEVIEDILGRKKHLKTQTKKDRESRFASLEDTFVLKRIPPDGHYLLLDDVLTTGSTLAHCINLFKDYPNIKISVITLAYTK